MNQRKASGRRASPIGLPLTGEAGGLTPPRHHLIKPRSTIAPMGGKKRRTAIFSGHHQTGTGEEAKLKLNTVRLTAGCVFSIFYQLQRGLLPRWQRSDVESVICRFTDLGSQYNKCSRSRQALNSP